MTIWRAGNSAMLLSLGPMPPKPRRSVLMYMSYGLVHAQRPGEFHLRKTQGEAELLQRNLAKDLIAPGRGAVALLLLQTADQVGKPLSTRFRQYDDGYI